MENTQILSTEEKSFERGVKEALFITANTLNLNTDGGRYNLSPVWDNINKKRIRTSKLPPRKEEGAHCLRSPVIEANCVYSP